MSSTVGNAQWLRLGVLFGLGCQGLSAQELSFEPLRYLAGELQNLDDVIAADLDDDGDPDILAVSQETRTLVWAENRGAEEGFVIHSIAVPCLDIRTLATGDLDGDGDADILAASVGENRLFWLENRPGPGRFSLQHTISDPAPGAYLPVSVDLDGDGDQDVLCTSYTEFNLLWYENLDGLGTFGIARSLSGIPPWPTATRCADVDGNGFQDVFLACSSTSGSTISLFLNTGTPGVFEEEAIITTLARGVNCLDLTDLDGDTDLDLLSASRSDGDIAWYENLDGQGNYGPQQLVDQISYATSVQAVDMDGDEDPDILASGHRMLAWWENTDDAGQFGARQVIANDLEYSIASLGADLDGDGLNDALVASSLDKMVALHRNLGPGNGFGPLQPVIHAGYLAGSSPVADLDGDGTRDLLLADDFGLFWGRGTGTDGEIGLLNPVLSAADLPDGASLPAAVLYDIDGDQDQDVVTSSYYFEEVAWLENMDGLGHFGTNHPVADVVSPGLPSIVDVDGDGDPDFVMESSVNTIWIENLGAGTTWEPHTVETSPYLLGRNGTADPDGDGDVDILGYGNLCDCLVWMENTDGQGTFGPPRVVTTTADSPVAARQGDADGDGDMDLLLTSLNDGKLAWHENLDGNGISWAEHVLVTDSPYMGPEDLADLDGDTDQDIVYLDFAHSVYWIENLDGAGSFGTPVHVSNGLDAGWYLVLQDMDDDGRIDILASTGTRQLAWLRNEGVVGVAPRDTTGGLPMDFRLLESAPNPFNPVTTLAYELDRAQHVSLQVFNIQGALVATLVDQVQPAGRYTLPFDGTGLASGVYVYRLEGDGRVFSQRMLLLK